MRKAKPYFCKCHLFYKLLVFHSYCRPSRLEMPPLFYDIFISSTWQSLSFLNAPIVLQFFNSLASQSIAFKKAASLLQSFISSAMQSLAIVSAFIFYNFFSSCERQSLTFVNAIFFIIFFLFHSYGRASRFEIPPLFYDIFITSAWQRLSFLNAPIVLQCFYHFGLSEHNF